MKTIGREQLIQLIRVRPALVVGPSSGSIPTIETQLLDKLKKSFPTSKDYQPSNWMDYADGVVFEKPDSELAIRNLIQNHFTAPDTRNPSAHGLAKIGTSAVISIACDEHLKEALREVRGAKPIFRPVATVSVGDEVIPKKSTAYYSMMGSCSDLRAEGRIPVTTSEFRRRVRSWPALLKTLPDVLQSDPVIVMGTEAVTSRLMLLLEEFAALKPGHPRHLVFVGDDPILALPSFVNFGKGLFDVSVFEGTQSDLTETISESSLNALQTPLFQMSKGGVIKPTALRNIEDHLAYVPKRDEVVVAKHEHHRNLDMLFRPTHLDWSPYALNLPFRRTTVGELEDAVIASLNGPQNKSGRIINLVGEAGIGKTTAMRIAAFTMSNTESTLSLWLRRSFHDLDRDAISKLISTIEDGVALKTRVIFWVDDPVALRLDVQGVTQRLSDSKLTWCMVIASRKSDFEVSETTASQAGIIEMPTEFNAQELAQLPDYLVKLKISSMAHEAQKYIESQMQNSRDALCYLYYLLPSTRAAIEGSIFDEHERLCQEPRKAVGSFFDAIEADYSSRIIARKAYEYVAVSSEHGSTDLPIEVLVSALKRDNWSYADWFDLAKPSKALWGLIYESQSDAAGSIVYKTRNEIITRVIVQKLNGASAFRAGEFRALKELLAVCDGSSAPYTTFLLETMVRRSSLIAKKFTLEQATELYDIAIGAARSHHDLIAHHRLNVMRKLGADPMEIYQGVNQLIIRRSSIGRHEETDSLGNLNSTAAAAIRKAVIEGQIDPVEGGRTAFDHIAVAVASDPLNLHALHIHSETMLEIAKHVREQDANAHFDYLQKAAQIIDHARLLLKEDRFIGAEFGRARQFFDESENHLVAQMDSSSFNEAAVFARFKSTKSQALLSLFGRRLLAEAEGKGSGSAFKTVDTFVRKAAKEIEELGSNIEPPFANLRAKLVISWHLKRNVGPVYWEQFLADIEIIVGQRATSQDPFWTFYRAVALFHLGKYSEAASIFHALRHARLPKSVLFTPRFFYLGDKSTPRILEGTIKSAGAGRRYIYCADLGDDFEVRQSDFTDSSAQVKHFKLLFRMAGLLACDQNYVIE